MSYNSMFFKNQAAEYSFYLLELSGEPRMDKLKITRFHYRSKSASKAWHDEILEKLNNGEMLEPVRQQAIEKLEEIYSNMIG